MLMILNYVVAKQPHGASLDLTKIISSWILTMARRALLYNPLPLLDGPLQLNYELANIDRRANNLVPTVSPTDTIIDPAGGGTYPRLAHLKDGSVLATFTQFGGGKSTLTVTRSTDGARAFSAWGTITSGTSNINDLDNTYVAQLANGDIVATFRNHDKTTAGAYTFFRITASISHDNGKTWAFLSQVDTRTAQGVNGLWEPFMRIAAGGALQVYYAAENTGNDQDVLMRSSTDGGKTWTHNDCRRWCHDWARRDAGVHGLHSGRGGATSSVVSKDDGATWGERSQAFVPTGSQNNAGAPSVVTTTGGTLVVSFMTDEDTQWVKGASMKILTSLSTDPPVWGQKTTVLGDGSLWPSMFFRVDGSNTAVGCADTKGVRCRSISFA
ncbi:glycoside hydrolase family 93 protein [Mycena latifolia]|nr:glycoside hydrolase family 93 protein [Mycena latifolia]